MTTTAISVTTMRTGIGVDGSLELQLIYGDQRGSTLWFRLSRAQALKLYRELDSLFEEEPPRFIPALKPAAE